jgi:hypothetical protein
MVEVHDRPGVTDPIWEYLLQSRLAPYIPYVREWWANLDSINVTDTGISELEGPPGFMMRFTRTPIRSPIKGIQAFPFVLTGYLQITGIQGGVVKMIERVCMDRKCQIDEFTIVEKHNLPSLFSNGQFVAFIPTTLLEDTRILGSWIYMTPAEMSQIVALEGLPETVKNKLLLKI